MIYINTHWKVIYTCDFLFIASIILGYFLLNWSKAPKLVASIHCIRKVDYFCTLFMGFSSFLIIYGRPYFMGTLVNNGKQLK